MTNFKNKAQTVDEKSQAASVQPLEGKYIIAGIWQNIGSSCVRVELCFLQPQPGMAGHFPHRQLEWTGQHIAEAVTVDNNCAYFHNNSR